MSIPRLSTFNSSFSVHKEYIYNYLSHSLKKKSLIVAIALSCLAACYLIKKIVQNWACKKNLNTNPPDQNRIASASEPILKKKEESEQPNHPFTTSSTSSTSPITTDEISEPFPFLKLPLVMQTEVYSFVELRELLTYKRVSTQIKDYFLRLPNLFKYKECYRSYNGAWKHEISCLENIINHPSLQNFLIKEENINFIKKLLNWLSNGFDLPQILKGKDKKFLQTIFNLFIKYSDKENNKDFIMCLSDNFLILPYFSDSTLEFILNGLSEDEERFLLNCPSSIIKVLFKRMSISEKINTRFSTAFFKKTYLDSNGLLYAKSSKKYDEYDDLPYLIKNYFSYLELMSLLEECAADASTQTEENHTIKKPSRARLMLKDLLIKNKYFFNGFFKDLFSSLKSLTMEQVKGLAWAIVEAEKSEKFEYFLDIFQTLKSLEIDIDQIFVPLLKEYVLLNIGKNVDSFFFLVYEMTSEKQIRAYIEAIKSYPEPTRTWCLRFLKLEDEDTEAMKIANEGRRNIFAEYQLNYDEYEYLTVDEFHDKYIKHSDF